MAALRDAQVGLGFEGGARSARMLRRPALACKGCRVLLTGAASVRPAAAAAHLVDTESPSKCQASMAGLAAQSEP